MTALTNKRCLPCEGIGRAYSLKEIQEQLGEIPGWSVRDDGKSIGRKLTLKNFVAAVDLVNKIKDIAEEQNHHPDLHLTGYKNLEIILNTHALGGVTENDFILAAKINEVAHV